VMSGTRGTTPQAQPPRLPSIGSSRIPPGTTGSPPSGSTTPTTAAAAAAAGSGSSPVESVALARAQSPPAAKRKGLDGASGCGGGNSSSSGGCGSSNTDDVEGVEVALLELLALIPLSAESIWEGDAELFPVLFQFKDNFLRLCERPALDESAAATSNVLAFNLPLQDFPVARKRFRVNRGLPTSALVTLLCSKLGVADPSRFALYSLKGFRLNPAEPLASYGFGTLFKSWELNVCRVRDRSKASLLLPPVSSSVVENETIVLIFPPLLELVGLQKKTTKLSREELNMPISEIIRHAWAKLGVPNPERFTLMASDDHGEHIVLAPDQSLRTYGLGWRFHGPWELRVVFISLATTSDTSRLPMRLFPWIDVPRSSPTLEEAIEAARALDAKLSAAEAEKKELRERESRALARITELEEHSKHVQDREQAVSEYQQKLASLSEALHTMEERLATAENELRDMGEPRRELSEAQERIAELEARLLESQNAVAVAEKALRQAHQESEALKGRCERIEADLRAQCEATAREIVRQEAVLAYACRLKRELEATKSKQQQQQQQQLVAMPGEHERKPVESDAVDTQLYNLTRANQDLMAKNRALQEENDRLKVLLAAASPPSPSASQSPSLLPAAPLQPARQQTRQSVAVTSVVTTSPISRRVSAPVPFRFASEISQIRERIQVTTAFAREHLLPRGFPMQPRLPPPVPPSASQQQMTMAEVAATRPVSMPPTTATERLQLLLKINDQKERMLRAAIAGGAGRRPSTADLAPPQSVAVTAMTFPTQQPTRDSIAITASSMYATLVRKFTESEGGGFEDLRQ